MAGQLLLDVPTNAYGKGPLPPISALDNRHLAAKVRPGTVQDLMSVAMVDAGMSVAMASLVRVAVVCHGVCRCEESSLISAQQSVCHGSGAVGCAERWWGLR